MANAAQQGLGDAPRVVSLPLMIGLVALPIVFGWLLLRRGYASSLRRIVCLYALTMPLSGLLVFLSLLIAAALRRGG